MKRKTANWLLILSTIAILGDILPSQGLAQDGTGINANGCNINPDKPLVRDGTVEAPAFARCTTELAGREIIVELWQRDNDNVWKEVDETDLTMDASPDFPTIDLSLTNISCRRLDRDRTRRYKTRIVVSDGNGNFTGGFSNVEELRRDCLEGMDEGDVEAESNQPGRSKRHRKPPRGAVVKDLKVKCSDLRDDPKLRKKAGCPSQSAVAVEAIVYGECGSSWVEVKNLGSGRAIMRFGWRSILGLVAVGESTVTWTNYSRNAGSFFVQEWIGPRPSDESLKIVDTGSGLVGALHSGEVFLIDPPISLYNFKSFRVNHYHIATEHFQRVRPRSRQTWQRTAFGPPWSVSELASGAGLQTKSLLT